MADLESPNAVSIDFNTNAEELAQEVYEFIQVRWPDWEPADGNPETWLTSAFARLAAELGELSVLVSMAIFKTYGTTIAGVADFPAAPSTTTTTWTMEDAAGYTVPAGTQIGVKAVDGTLYAFETVDDFTVAPGSTIMAGVTVRAVVEGSATNGLSGPADLIDALGFVLSVTLDAPTANGTDEEDINTYLNRLSDELRLLTPRPILPSDFEVLAKQDPRPARVLAVDGWDPVADTLGNEKYVGMAMIDDTGAALATVDRDDIVAQLDAMREVNFVVAGGDPTYTAIDATVTVRCYPTFDPAVVHDDVLNAISTYLSPINWGVPAYGPDGTAWLNTTTLGYKEMASVIDRVNGVAFIESLSIAIGGGALGTGDIALPGTVPLTEPGTINVTADPAP